MLDGRGCLVQELIYLVGGGEVKRMAKGSWTKGSNVLEDFAHLAKDTIFLFSNRVSS